MERPCRSVGRDGWPLPQEGAARQRRIARQLQAVLQTSQVAAVKIGMVPTAAALQKILRGLPADLWVVLDPVVRTSRGQRLSSLSPGDFLRAGRQAGKRLVLTPNRDELRWLGLTARQLLEAGYAAVVVKGGSSGIDQLVQRAGTTLLRGSPLPRSKLHHRGTGCRFGSQLAASLARGEDLVSAARDAKRLVRKFLRSRTIAQGLED